MKAELCSLVVTVALSGCALLGKSEPVVPRYFAAEYDGEAHAARARPELQLRLDRVEGWSHLRERMVVRSSAREFLFREDRRWLERPEVYLRRALARTLFEERGVVEAISGRAVTLEVELIAFEELAQPHEIRLQARVVLIDDRVALLSETITVEQPVGSEGSDPVRAVVDAYSKGLRTEVRLIADRVIARLGDRAASGANGAPDPEGHHARPP
ncbi:MAG: ABC-type transport auxiliary lipoprotein family protein [Anaeromyxobacteraceae bacterium]